MSLLLFNLARCSFEELSILIIFKMQLYAGRALFQLDLSNLRPEFSSLIGKRLQVEAAVTEKSSGIKQTSINRDCAFVTSPYIITFEGTPWNFSPRLTFRFEVILPSL